MNVFVMEAMLRATFPFRKRAKGGFCSEGFVAWTSEAQSDERK
jgi:hypothetical protein